MLDQAGCSVHEIASVSGHKNLAQVQPYTAEVERAKLASAAVLRFPTLQTRQTKLKAAE